MAGTMDGDQEEEHPPQPQPILQPRDPCPPCPEQCLTMTSASPDHPPASCQEHCPPPTMTSTTAPDPGMIAIMLTPFWSLIIRSSLRRTMSNTHLINGFYAPHSEIDRYYAHGPYYENPDKSPYVADGPRIYKSDRHSFFNGKVFTVRDTPKWVSKLFHSDAS